MGNNIHNTVATTSLTYDNKTEISLSKLAGNKDDTNIRLFHNSEVGGEFLELNLCYKTNVWFFHFFTKNRVIYKGSKIEMNFADETLITISINTGGIKIAKKWLSIGILSYENLYSATLAPLISVKVLHDARNSEVRFGFADKLEGQYGTRNDGGLLFQVIAQRLVEEFTKYKAQQETKISIPVVKPPKYNLKPITPDVDTSTSGGSFHGRILNREYNLNTKYGRRMARRQANYNYDHGSQQYRDSIDEIGCVFWTVIFVLCLIIFLIICYVSGPEAAIKWLK